MIVYPRFDKRSKLGQYSGRVGSQSAVWRCHRLMSAGFEYRLPTVRCIQARREYRGLMCSIHLIFKTSSFDEDEPMADLRAQRHLKRSGAAEGRLVMSGSLQSYVSSALADGDIAFEPLQERDDGEGVGIPVGVSCDDRRSGLLGTAVRPPDHQRHQAAARARSPARGTESRRCPWR